MENETHYAEAVIDNGTFGTRTIRFETGRLAKQAMRLRRRVPGRRHHGAVGHHRFQAAQGPARLLPPHGGRRGAAVRRQDPRLLLPPGGPPLRGRDPHLPSDRPPAAPLLQEGPAQRDPDRRDDHGAQPRPPVRRGRDQRRLRFHDPGGPALLRPHRRHPRRPDQGPVGRLPDAHRARGRRLRHGRRGSRPGGRRRRDHDGRGRGHREDHPARPGRRRGPDRRGRRRRSGSREALHQGALQGPVGPRRQGCQAHR